MTKPIYAIEADRIDGKPASLSEYAGKVMLIVNVASKCGLTPQYDGLEKLYAEHKDEGLVVLGFPANNFAGQEPGTNEEIATFCRATYGVDFPMFSKVSVAGADQAPLYKTLIAAQPKRTLAANPRPGAAQKADDKAVRWNFEKFLVSREGEVVGRFDPDVTPGDPILVAAVERELAR
ncbi:MAG TPA: glutathione peroxidase [Bauldia sp.]|nr:glutathione peroxidase [Bauldia sp.]